MADFEIDFEWPRAPAYKLETDKYIQPLEEWDTWMDGPDDREERVFGRIVAQGEPRLRRPKTSELDYAVKTLLQIASVEARHNDDDRLEQQRELEDLVRPMLHEAVPKLAGMLGLLYVGPIVDGLFGSAIRKRRKERELISSWYSLARALKLMFDYEKKPFGSAFGGVGVELGVYLVPAETGVNLAVRPPNLWSAIMVHGARSVASGTGFSVCRSCNIPFLTGGQRARFKKKSGSQFCSEKCRWDFNNAKRRKRR
jgi:hypothetical protein